MNRRVPLLLTLVALVVFGVGLATFAILPPVGGFLALVLSPMPGLVAIILRTDSLIPDHKLLLRTATIVLAVALVDYFLPFAAGRLEWDAPREVGANENLWLAAWWLLIALVVITMTLITYGLLQALGLGLARWVVAPVIGAVSGFLILLVFPLVVPVVQLVALILSVTATVAPTEPLEEAAAHRT